MATINLKINPITGTSTQPDDDDYKLEFNENIEAGRVIGVLTGFLSPADRESANFAPVTSSGNPGDDGGRFEIVRAEAAGPGYSVGDWIVVIKNGGENYFNYENNGGFANLFTYTSVGPNVYNVSIDVVVQDINEQPENISLAGGPVTSGSAGATVGMLSAVDEDDIFSHGTGETQVTYSIDAGLNGDLFTISGNTLSLRAGVSLDYNSAPKSELDGRRYYEVIVRATDGGGYDMGSGEQNPATSTSSTQVVKIYVTAPANTAPTDIDLSVRTVAEDRQAGHVVGLLSATDAQGGAMTYEIVTDADSKFVIVGNELRVRTGATFDFEGKTTHDVRVRVTDSGGLTYEKTITVTVTNVNERPTDISLVGTSVTSTAGGSTRIGDLSFTDPDIGATGTFSIVTDANNYFQIDTVGGVVQLQVRDGANLAAGTYDVVIRVTDQGGLFRDETFTITVTQGNTAPTDIDLSVRTVAEDRQAGHVVGLLSATDAQGGAMTYEIVTDADSKFVIVGNELRVRTGATFDFEGKTTHDVRVRVTDSGGLTYEKTITVTVTNVNERPNDISLSNSTVSTTAGGGEPVGELGFEDPDAGATGTYSIVTNPNNYFQLGMVEGVWQLQVRNGANLAAGTYDVVIRVTDQGNLTRDETFTITITDDNVAPRITGALNPVTKTTADTANIQAFSAVTIQDAGDLTVVVRMDAPSKGRFVGTGGVYDQAAGTFTITGTASHVTTVLQALQFDARDKAAGSGAEVTTFTITVTDGATPPLSTSNSNISVSATAPTAPPANQAPTGLSLSNLTIQELSKTGAEIATMSATDADGDSLSYKIQLANGALVDTDGYFTVSGNKLVVANGVMFDAEQALTRPITLQVSDGRGGTATQTFTINISDKSPEIMTVADASPFNDIIKGSKTGNFKDVFFGGAGDDKLWGGYGNDTLWGGVGKDIFVFDGKLGTASTDRKVNFDTIKDYSVKDDAIWLDNDLFKANKKLYGAIKKGAETKPLKMASKFFTVGDKAKDADDYFVYDAKKRVLYYDADGNGSKAAIEMATFTNNKALKGFGYKEFFFI